MPLNSVSLFLQRLERLAGRIGQAGDFAGEGLAQALAGLAGLGQRAVHGAVERADLLAQRPAQALARSAGAVDGLRHRLVEARQFAGDALAHFVAGDFQLLRHFLRQRVDGADLGGDGGAQFAGDGLDLAARIVDRIVQRRRHAGTGVAQAGDGHARYVDRLLDQIAQLDGAMLEIAQIGHARRHRGVESQPLMRQSVDQFGEALQFVGLRRQALGDGIDAIARRSQPVAQRISALLDIGQHAADGRLGILARLAQYQRQAIDGLLLDMNLHLAAERGDQGHQQQGRRNQAQHQHGDFMRQQRIGGVLPAHRVLDIEEIDRHPGNAGRDQQAPRAAWSTTPGSYPFPPSPL